METMTPGARPEEALPEEGVPQLRPVTARRCCARRCAGAGRTCARAPLWGLFFAGVYVVIGWALAWVTLATGKSYWLIFAALSFPAGRALRGRGPLRGVAAPGTRASRWTGGRS